MIKKAVYLFVFSIVMLFFSCSEQSTVARIGNHRITLEDFQYSYNQSQGVLKAQSTTETKTRHLNNMIEAHLKYNDALKNGIELDPEQIEKLLNIENKQIHQVVIRDNVVFKVISEDDIKTRARYIETHIKTSDILLRTTSKTTDQEKEQIKNRLLEIRNDILLGKISFADAARKVSEDSLSSGKGGDLGFLDWNPSEKGMAFKNALYNLKLGEISDPIETKDGFHLIKAEEFRKNDQFRYLKLREEILRDFYKENRAVMDSVYFDFAEMLKEKYKMEFDSTSVEYLSSLIQDIREKGDNKTKSYYFEMMKRQVDKSRVLVRYKKTDYTINDLIKRLDPMSPMGRPNIITSRQIYKALNRIIPPKLVIEYGKEKGYQNHLEVKNYVESTRQRFIINAFTKVKINEKLENIDTSELEQFYKENSKLFKTPVKYNVQEIYIKDKNVANAVHKKLVKNPNMFDQYVKQYNERVSTKDKNGKLGYISEKQYGMVGRTAPTLKVGEISDVIKSGSRFSIIKVLSTKESESQDFSVIHDQVEKEYKVMKREKLETEWLESLKSGKNIQIYSKNLEKVE